MNGRNPDLDKLHGQLIDLVDELTQQQERAQTVEAVKAIGREISEVNHRVTLVGQLVFKAQTARITAAVKRVNDGKKALNKAIKEIEKLNAFLNAVTRFLALVDKVIDTAKLL